MPHAGTVVGVSRIRPVVLQGCEELAVLFLCPWRPRLQGHLGQGDLCPLCCHFFLTLAPSPPKLQAERGSNWVVVVVVALSSYSHPCASCVTNQICPPFQLEINSRKPPQMLVWGKSAPVQPQAPGEGVEALPHHRSVSPPQRYPSHLDSLVSAHLPWEVAHAVPLLAKGTRTRSPFTSYLMSTRPRHPPGRADAKGLPGSSVPRPRERVDVFVSGCVRASCPGAAELEPGMQRLPLQHPCRLPAPPGEAVLPPPLHGMGSLALRLQLELSDSHFPFIKLTNKCPAGEQASSIDSAPPRDPSVCCILIYVRQGSTLRCPVRLGWGPSGARSQQRIGLERWGCPRARHPDPTGALRSVKRNARRGKTSAAT